MASSFKRRASLDLELVAGVLRKIAKAQQSSFKQAAPRAACLFSLPVSPSLRVASAGTTCVSEFKRFPWNSAGICVSCVAVWLFGAIVLRGRSPGPLLRESDRTIHPACHPVATMSAKSCFAGGSASRVVVLTRDGLPCALKMFAPQ